MDLPEMNEIARRTGRYSLEDGINEMLFGFMLVLVGLSCFAEAVLKHAPVIGMDSWKVGFLALVLCGSFLCRRLGRKLKSRFVEPRAGLIVLRKPTRGAKLMGLVFGVFFLFVLGFVLTVARHHYPAASGWYTLVISVMISGFLLIGGIQLRLRRFGALAVFSLALGIASFSLRLGDNLSGAAYFFFFGLALIAGGGLALRSFLRRPILTENEP